MTKVAKFVGLDVHKDTIASACCQGGPIGDPTAAAAQTYLRQIMSARYSGN